MISSNWSAFSARIGLWALLAGMLLTPQTLQAGILEDTFSLHSYPSATKVIYLDFNGHDGLEPGADYYEPFSFEGSGSTFSDAELTVIQRAWQSASEDFLPFDVDVTTEDPGVEALRKTGGGDINWGIRAVVSASNWNYSWAYIGSFNWNTDYECQIYPGNNSWIWIADSISHEVGHALWLDHDGGGGDGEYYEGHGSGATYWSPIMGWTKMTEPYGVSQWSKGEYDGANNSEDDLAIITTQNGFGYRPDDHGSTTATATAVSSGVVAEGIIERNTDLDYFSFTMPSAGNVQLAIDPDNLAPNLDILAKLHDADGTVLHTSNPSTALNAEFDVSLPAGDYYLSIDGTGFGDPATGYSDYGSLGYYSVSLSTTSTPCDPCDFDCDGNVDINDVDALTSVGNLAAGASVTPATAKFDLNGDDTVNTADLDKWRADAATYNGFGSPYLVGDANLDGDVDVWQLDGNGDAQLLSSSLGAPSGPDGHDVGAEEAEALYDPATGELYFDVGADVSVIDIGSAVMFPGNIDPFFTTNPVQNDGTTLAFCNPTGLPVGEDSVGLMLPAGLAQGDMFFSYTPVGGATAEVPVTLIGAVWSDGDFNADGDVDVWQLDGDGDAQLLSSNLGTSMDAGTQAPVTMIPEPTALALLGIGIVCVSFVRRRRKWRVFAALRYWPRRPARGDFVLARSNAWIVPPSVALLVLLVAGSVRAAADPAVQAVADVVSQTRYQTYHLDVENMGLGLYGGAGYDMGYRNRDGWAGAGSLGNQEARLYLQDTFAATGLSVSVQGSYLNVVGELAGTTTPENIYIIGGHYDHIAGDRPGGDDNASGTAGVLEAARVLSQYQFESTIRFIAFNAEEDDLLGSKDYIDNHVIPAGENVVGMVNMDMILRPGSDVDPNTVIDAELETNGSMPWLRAYQQAAADYVPSLIIGNIWNGRDSWSDNDSFQDRGIPSFLVIENSWDDWDVANPYYHTREDASDRLANGSPNGVTYDYAFATDVTRAAVALIAQEATLVPEPSTLTLLGAAVLGCLVLLARRRK